MSVWNYRGDIGRKAAVHAEEGFVDDGRNRQRVKARHHRLVHRQRVLVGAWRSEAERPSREQVSEETARMDKRQVTFVFEVEE